MSIVLQPRGSDESERFMPATPLLNTGHEPHDRASHTVLIDSVGGGALSAIQSIVAIPNYTEVTKQRKAKKLR